MQTFRPDPAAAMHTDADRGQMIGVVNSPPPVMRAGVPDVPNRNDTARPTIPRLRRWIERQTDPFAAHRVGPARIITPAQTYQVRGQTQPAVFNVNTRIRRPQPAPWDDGLETGRG